MPRRKRSKSFKEIKINDSIFDGIDTSNWFNIPVVESLISDKPVPFKKFDTTRKTK